MTSAVPHLPKIHVFLVVCSLLVIMQTVNAAPRHPANNRICGKRLATALRGLCERGEILPPNLVKYMPVIYSLNCNRVDCPPYWATINKCCNDHCSHHDLVHLCGYSSTSNRRSIRNSNRRRQRHHRRR